MVGVASWVEDVVGRRLEGICRWGSTGTGCFSGLMAGPAEEMDGRWEVDAVLGRDDEDNISKKIIKI